jgi:hypothetical protein
MSFLFCFFLLASTLTEAAEMLPINVEAFQKIFMPLPSEGEGSIYVLVSPPLDHLSCFWNRNSHIGESHFVTERLKKSVARLSLDHWTR